MGRNKKTTNNKGNKGPAPKGANPDRRIIPRDPEYDSLNIRDTPLTARGARLVYNALGSTDAGRMWSLVALHPCGEYVSSCDGIPDESAASAVTPTYRAHTTITWNPDLFDKAPSPPTGFSYDVQIITPPFPEIDYLYRLRFGGTWSRWQAVKLPSFETGASGSSTTFSSLGMSKYRFMARGMTLYLDAPRLSDNGRYTAGQIAAPIQVLREDWTQASATDKVSGKLYGAGQTTVYSLFVPQDEDQLTLQDTLSCQWPARDGGYIPHRFVSPVQLYLQTGSDGVARIPLELDDGKVTNNFVPETFLRISDISGGISPESSQGFANLGITPTWVKAPGSSPIDPKLGIWGVSQPGNIHTGVSFFKAISGTASIQVKSRVYIEAEAAEKGSPAAPFAHKPPTLDRPALDIVTKVSQVQPHVFFARDNDFSSILASIGKILPSVMQWIQPYADKASETGLPFVSPLGRGLGAFTRGFGSAYKHFVG
uniref:Putative capsid protein n=1 Tax=Golovinomyces cichoracearum associated tombus-like virus 1 TaxID=2754854 RepID=A0A7D6EVT5_9TOMB|nr:putative capsid protein [Golovinomyces cichoracearum associated tombus-like virus 1]